MKDSILLRSRRQAIQDKINYLRSILRQGIGPVEIFIRPEKVDLFEENEMFTQSYVNAHDVPFNLKLEVSILLHDAIEQYEDMICEIDFQLGEL